MEHKAMFRTTPNLHVLRERLTRDHKLIGSFTREQEGSGGIMCFAAKLVLAMFRSHIPWWTHGHGGKISHGSGQCGS